MHPIKQIDPRDIESSSFAIIEREFIEQTGVEPAAFSKEQFQVVRRVIHATGDFSFAKSLLFHREAISAGLNAIRNGRDIYIDVTMGAAGISRSILKKYGGEVHCHINDPDIPELARQHNKTRSETALARGALGDPGIVAVGNAPSALITAMRMIQDRKFTPELVIGVPVGFVNAIESKELLQAQPYPYITNSGRKGGSPVAVAIVNALLRIAEDDGS